MTFTAVAIGSLSFIAQLVTNPELWIISTMSLRSQFWAVCDNTVHICGYWNCAFRVLRQAPGKRGSAYAGST